MNTNKRVMAASAAAALGLLVAGCDNNETGGADTGGATEAPAGTMAPTTTETGMGGEATTGTGTGSGAETDDTGETGTDTGADGTVPEGDTGEAGS